MSEKAPALCLHLRILHTFHIRARAMNAERGGGGGEGERSGVGGRGVLFRLPPDKQNIQAVF